MLDSDNCAFIQTGVSISLAACGPNRMPSMSRGMGCKVIDGGQKLGIFVRCAQSADLLAGIRRSGKVANVFTLPSTNRTLQLKGVDAQVLAFDPDDLPIIEAHVRDLVAEITPAWPNFPTEDVAADTTRMNRELEAVIRTMPSQYYWVHKRFKSRPEGEPSVYA